MSNGILKVALVQIGLAWEDKSQNLERIENFIQANTDGEHIIVLPEMFSTGFTTNSKKFAETMIGDTVQWMLQISKKFQAAICGSLIILDTGNYYNRFIWTDPSGNISHYDKKYLFTPAGEDMHYSSGEKQVCIPYLGWNIRPLICYDLRFPEWSRHVDDYDLLIYVASWPSTRTSHWTKLLQARAIENQCYVAGVNRIGIDGNNLHYSGDSMIVDFSGEILCHQEIESTYLKTSIDLQALKKYRKKLPFLKDQH